jgi:ABC-type branched-subunit amino acid transport system permease subunit
VPFGQALFYATGAYAVALLGRYTPIRDVFVAVLIGAAAAGVVAFATGFLLARYREIFFAMLSMAMSMILYGVLVKTETLGSTDGFHVEAGTFFGYRPHGAALNLALFWFVLGFSALAAIMVSLYFRSVAGSLAVPVRDNEIRLEFLGVSATGLIHVKLVISGILAGVGGALAALAIGHVDPNMSYWTTSGGFVFVTILAGASSISAAFVGSFLFEFVRSIAIDIMPGTWQIILGSALLLSILFLPEGLGSLFARLRRRTETRTS